MPCLTHAPCHFLPLYHTHSPAAALSYLGPEPHSHHHHHLHLGATASAATDTECDESELAGGGGGGHSSSEPQEPFPKPLAQLLLPAALAGAALKTPPEGVEMREVAVQDMQGVDTQQLAQVGGGGCVCVVEWLLLGAGAEE